MERAKLIIHQGRRRYSLSPEPLARRRTKKESNPLRAGIIEFCSKRNVIVSEATEAPLSVSDLPKRFTLYTPLLLLPANFHFHSPRWEAFYHALSDEDRAELWRNVAEDGFKAMGVTHIAINAPISAEKALDYADEEVDSNEIGVVSADNVMRSPTGLVPAYGDWGSRVPGEPTALDLESAFWIQTSQHPGIIQVWSPLYTMFSRGNVTEKSRILGSNEFERVESGLRFPGLSEEELGEAVEQIDVIDFYVGIGYFAFSYLKRGVRRVWGWDINAWSIEGLRRGCEANSWGVLVVPVDDEGKLVNTCAKEIVETILRNDQHDAEDPSGKIRVVAFHGDNSRASEVMQKIECEFEAAGEGLKGPNFRHANLGLLPTSKASWKQATDLVARSKRSAVNGLGWLHIHENCDVQDIGVMQEAIVDQIGQMAPLSAASCSSVHEVKTFAPGVMHCVFDILINPNA